MFMRKKAGFSNDGELFAFANERGSLKIWETCSNTLKQEYALSSHANLTCSSLIWGPSKNETNTFEKSSTFDSDILDFRYQYLAIGTEEGDVILYNYDKGKLSYNFTTSHTGSVNDLCWHMDSNRAFTCSSDKSIVIWDLVTGKLKSKWEADDEPLYSLCVIDSDNLLSASTSISWWNINEQTVIMKFCGHDSAIFSLLTLSSTDLSLNSYFLSAAVGESKISAWCLKKTNSRTVVASFDVSDELQSIDITKNFSKDKPMFLSTVTKTGSLLLFKHVLNGKTKKNLTPQMILHVVSKPTGEFSKPSPIPVIASKFSKCSESSMIAYGNFENPTFEKVKIIDCPKTLTLARDKPLQQVNSSDGIMPNMKLYNKLGEYVSANGDLSDSNSSYSPSKRRKQKDLDIDLIDLEEITDEIRTVSPDHRTASGSINKKKHRKVDKKISTPPHTHNKNKDTILTDPSSICNRLLQCLETEDRTLLSEVLQVSDDQLIKNSVAKLPRSCVQLFLKELHTILTSQEQRYTSSSRKWLKEILNVHLLYLVTCKDNVEILNIFKEYVDSKRVSETLMKMSTLRGLLNIHRIQRASQIYSDSEEQVES